jgi:hypothetical protein
MNNSIYCRRLPSERVEMINRLKELLPLPHKIEWVPRFTQLVLRP